MPLSMRPALTAEGRRALGFLFFVLALHSPSEVPNPLAEATAQLGDPARAEDEDDDDEDEEQLRKAETEHERLPRMSTAQSTALPDLIPERQGSRIAKMDGTGRTDRPSVLRPVTQLECPPIWRTHAMPDRAEKGLTRRRFLEKAGQGLAAASAFGAMANRAF